MLSFIGSGSAFNTSLGNNGAFIKKDNILFMIDCGSSTFDRIKKANLLDGVEHIHVLLTHTHPDHVGSLGDLIFYGYYAMGEIMKPSVTVHSHQLLQISKLLKMLGVEKETYNLEEFFETFAMGHGNFTISVDAIPVKHVKELYCFGFVIRYEDEVAYYSGDSNEIPLDILDDIHANTFDYIYQDTCKAHYEGNVHLSLIDLDELIGNDFRDKVFCMHLDGGFVREEAEALGFNVVKSII